MVVVPERRRVLLVGIVDGARLAGREPVLRISVADRGNAPAVHVHRGADFGNAFARAAEVVIDRQEVLRRQLVGKGQVERLSRARLDGRPGNHVAITPPAPRLQIAMHLPFDLPHPQPVSREPRGNRQRVDELRHREDAELPRNRRGPHLHRHRPRGQQTASAGPAQGQTGAPQQLPSRPTHSPATSKVFGAIRKPRSAVPASEKSNMPLIGPAMVSNEPPGWMRAPASQLSSMNRSTDA
jgi:hypothetical protein